jgi:hypothetical protein
MQELNLREGLIVTSSLLSAWVVIHLVTVFVANPLASRIIALFAWGVAALNSWLNDQTRLRFAHVILLIRLAIPKREALLLRNEA